jgi:hypothetical protein
MSHDFLNIHSSLIQSIAFGATTAGRCMVLHGALRGALRGAAWCWPRRFWTQPTSLIHSFIHSLEHRREDMVLAAQMLNSTDFNDDGTPDHSLCLQLTECPWDGGIAVSAILATMTQTAGPRTGFLWDPETMEPLGKNGGPAAAHARAPHDTHKTHHHPSIHPS